MSLRDIIILMHTFKKIAPSRFGDSKPATAIFLDAFYYKIDYDIIIFIWTTKSIIL